MLEDILKNKLWQGLLGNPKYPVSQREQVEPLVNEAQEQEPSTSEHWSEVEPWLLQPQALQPDIEVSLKPER